ncbi:hypothetical protein ACIVBQ_000562 [Tenacibaculum discolor]
MLEQLNLLRLKKIEMIQAFNSCIEHSNIEDARAIAKRIKNTSLKILRLEHHINFNV